MAKAALSSQELFWAKVNKTKTCWLWTGQILPSGHARCRLYGKSMFASRASWIIHYGEILPGMTVCHQCPNPACVRPTHLALGTIGDNMRSGKRPYGSKLLIEYKKPIRTVEERFWSKVQKDADSQGCWLWIGPIQGWGYGVFGIGGRKGKQFRAHRLAWEWTYGSIPGGLWVLHRCDNPACVNPEHLWLGTHTENMQDMMAKGRNGHITHPERLARGERNGAYTKPETRARGERHGSRTKPERVPRGERHGSRTHPEALERGDRHYSHRTPERVLRGERHGMTKIADAQVVEIRALYTTGAFSYNQLARQFHVSRPTITRIVTGKTHAHVPMPKEVN